MKGADDSKRQPNAGTALPIVVSIATIPSRIGHIRRTIDSLLQGALVPSKILIVHPDFCRWENSSYDVPDFLRDPNYCRGIVEAYEVSEDWGPGTKILGALEVLKEDCILVLADDDVEYEPTFLKTLIALQSVDLGSCYSHFVYRKHGLRFGQGCDGYSFYTPNLESLRSFAEDHVRGTSLLYHDDLWIAFYLFSKGIPVKKVPSKSGETIYRQVLPNDVLSSQQSGALERDQIVHDNLERLISSCRLPPPLRALLRMRQLQDLIRYSAARIQHRIRRALNTR